jgi:hypothetical protein
VIEQVAEGGRNPNAFDLLVPTPSAFRWAAVCEHRPCLMGWFVMRPRRAPQATAARSCGGCTLCCKLEKIPELDKPRYTWCRHCDVGAGCQIYDSRPQVCRAFPCYWLNTPDMPDALRPDRVGLYAAGKVADGYLRVVVDPAVPEAWRSGGGKAAIDHITSQGLHVLVNVERQLHFVQGNGTPMPSKILLDWTL